MFPPGWTYIIINLFWRAIWTKIKRDTSITSCKLKAMQILFVNWVNSLIVEFYEKFKFINFNYKIRSSKSYGPNRRQTDWRRCYIFKWNFFWEMSLKSAKGLKVIHFRLFCWNILILNILKKLFIAENNFFVKFTRIDKYELSKSTVMVYSKSLPVRSVPISYR